MKKTKIFSVLFLAITIIFCCSACGKQSQSAPATTTATEKETSTEAVEEESKEEETAEPEETASNNGEPMEIHVGDFIAETFLYPVKLAVKLGFFEEEFSSDQVTICIDYLGSGTVMNEALTSGELDMSFLGGQPTFSGIANGNGVKIITMATVSSTDPCLLVAADSEYKEVSELAGKNLAVNIGTDNHYQMLEMLALGGLTEDDIALYNLKGNEALAALLSGEVDCMQSICPNKWRYILDGDVRVLTTMEETTGRNNQVLVATSEFIEEHPDMIVRFLKVLQRAVDYYQENKEECWDLLAEYCDADRSLMDYYMDDYDCSLGLTDADKEYMANVYQFLYSHDMLDTSIDLADIYDESFLMEAFGTVDCH
ncbi:MAG: ABC transporter substrate-binding protein [Clostridiales bacterium]|nr:ABC transporter substrate-binding protein [Clostridiales bacterium]